MLKKERQTFILNRINLHNKVLSADLSVEMNVSEDTVRRDLLELSDEGKLIKVHGGALSPSFHAAVRSNAVYAAREKKLIAAKAACLIEDGMFVLTTGGTTIIELARSLPSSLHATFFTTSIPAAYEYTLHPNIEVIFIGDKVSKQAQLAVGTEAISTIRKLRADCCLLGTNAVDAVKGVTDNDWEVVQVKRAMIASSDKVITLAISAKLNTEQRLPVCSPGQISMLITELDPDDPLLLPYREAGIQVL
jgi:DeoR/GlpR family transcriptional regulator of sugar metabolism